MYYFMYISDLTLKEYMYLYTVHLSSETGHFLMKASLLMKVNGKGRLLMEPWQNLKTSRDHGDYPVHYPQFRISLNWFRAWTQVSWLFFLLPYYFSLTETVSVKKVLCSQKKWSLTFQWMFYVMTLFILLFYSQKTFKDGKLIFT